MKRHTAPIIAAVLLLLPVLYVGGYFALVRPGGRLIDAIPTNESFHYRIIDRRADWLFWPLEQIDRKIRPKSWLDLPGD